ncbi:RanBD1 domain-containing protein [Meloidogyne graminicola]|uniref:RanBD1 domain-containing protein n=1 Tax=Meloidogyne graminicola TaxID=189291 RepID=A0A8S9ZUZ1_9BILA|nr:RanBD1 domain-containing protein [Meloidogyne graminicola]
MDLTPSKLASTASRVWDESTSHFHKTDINIDLGLHGLSNTKNGKENSSEKASSSSSRISSGYVFGSRLFERSAQKEESTSSTSSESDTSKASIDVSSIFRRIGQKNNANGTNMWKTGGGFSSIKLNGGNGEIKDSLSSIDKLKESAEELAHKNASIVAADDGEQPTLVVTGEEDEKQLLKIDCKFYHYNSETKQWQERGMGTLRLNQHIGSKDDIRLIARQSGSQRVLINSKIFPEMLLQELSEKRIQISAHTGEIDLPPQLFIIQSSPSSIANLRMLLQQYIEASCTVKNRSSSTSQQRKRRLEEEEKGVKKKQKSIEESSSTTDKGAKKFVKEKSPNIKNK